MLEISVCTHKPLWALAQLSKMWETFHDGLADVGDCRCTGLSIGSGDLFGNTVSRSSVSQTSCSARNSMEEIESCGEKCTNLYRVYKLIMISRVPGYGHLEYLVLELLC